MKRFSFLSMLAVIVLTLSACGPVISTPSAASQNAPLEVQDESAYLLGPGDIVKLTVYGEDTITGPYTVDQHGNVIVPMIGETQAAGLSKEDLQKSIANKMVSSGYLKKPIVTVDVNSMRPFYIIGEVKTPGSYPWQPSLDVFKAIATAGGYTPRAAENRVLIDRGQGDHKVRLNATENTPVLPGDSIIVRERIF
jgi:protein involved in polysaccharide export with SLBB domain